MLLQIGYSPAAACLLLRNVLPADMGNGIRLAAATSHSKRFAALPASYTPILAEWKMAQSRQRAELGTL